MAEQNEHTLLTVAGIDLGTRHAALVVIEGTIVKYGKLLKNPSLAELWDELDSINKRGLINYVSCEKPYYHKNVRSAFVLYEQLGVIKLFCQKNNIEFITLSPSTIKKFISGKGNASKEKISQLTKIRLNDPNGILITESLDLSDAASIALATLIIKKKVTRLYP